MSITNFQFFLRSRISLRETKLKTQKGFTIVELLIYMGLFSIFLTVISQIFTNSLTVSTESTSLSNVGQDGRYILSQMSQNIRKAQVISIPLSNGSSTNMLEISVNSDVNTYSLDGNNNLILTNSNGSNMLNSFESSISAFTVSRLGNPGGAHDTVRIVFTVQSRAKNASGVERQTFQTSVGKRQ